MDKIICTAEADGFTVGEEYPASLKTHRSLRKDGSLVQPTIARCVETANDNGKIVLFTEAPSAEWHEPYSSFREAFQISEYDKKEKISHEEFLRAHELFEKESGISLHPAQKSVAFWTLNRDHVLIHGQTGTGKTIVGVFLAWYAWRIKLRTVVIVAPKALCASWEFTCAKAGMFFSNGVQVWSQSRVGSSEFPGCGSDTEVILDEAHFLCHLPKDPILFVHATSDAARKTAFTATPERIESADYFAIYGWLLVPGWSKGKISKAFPYPIYDKSSYRPDHKVLQDHTITLTLDEMKEMPKLDIWVLPVPAMEAQPLRRNRNYRAEIASRLVLEGHKFTLIFANEIHQLVYMQDRLADLGISCVTITGETENPQAVLNEFNARRCSILLMTASMGVGLSVETAERVIFLQVPKGAVQLNQCLGRAYRLTTDHPVETFFFEDGTSYLPTLLGFVNSSREEMGLEPLTFQMRSKD